MSAAPGTIEELAQLIATAPSPAVLLETFMSVEGDISLRFGNTHLTSDTDFLTVYFSAYILALLLEDEIDEARMLRTRMPPSLIKAHSVMENTVTLLVAVWNHNHSLVYQIIRDPGWPGILKPLVENYSSHFQSKALRDLSVSYETIRPSTVAEYLGIDSTTDEPSANVVEALTAKGWEWNSETKLFHPKPDAQKTVPNGTEKIKIGQLATLIGGHSRQSV